MSINKRLDDLEKALDFEQPPIKPAEWTASWFDALPEAELDRMLAHEVLALGVGDHGDINVTQEVLRAAHAYLADEPEGADFWRKLEKENRQ